jgi:AcrR family transcriptional regulator
LEEMARVRSPKKRNAILQAAVHEIAKVGLGAPTAKIAKRAGVAAGTLFIYFPNKEDLLNALYIELKREVSARINANCPHQDSLGSRARHLWWSSLDCSIEVSRKTQSFDAVGRLQRDHARKQPRNTPLLTKR